MSQHHSLVEDSRHVINTPKYRSLVEENRHRLSTPEWASNAHLLRRTDTGSVPQDESATLTCWGEQAQAQYPRMSQQCSLVENRHRLNTPEWASRQDESDWLSTGPTGPPFKGFKQPLQPAFHYSQSYILAVTYNLLSHVLVTFWHSRIEPSTQKMSPTLCAQHSNYVPSTQSLSPTLKH